jgi:hypothetical protein
MLAPPGASAEAPLGQFRAHLGGRSQCAGTDAVAVERKGARLRVAVRRDALAARPRGWLTTWTEEAEAAGCVAPGGAAALAEQVLGSVALPTGVDMRLLRVDGAHDFVEVGAGNRLQASSPILREGATSGAQEFETGKITAAGGNNIAVELKSSPDLIGVETAWYELRPKADGRGHTIVAAEAETSIHGKVEKQPGPAKPLFQFGPEMGYYRLFYKADQSEVLVAAAARAALPADADACESARGVVCLAIPHGVGVNPYITVHVNGSKVAVGIGTNLGSLLRLMGRNAGEAPPGLRISRLWRNRMLPLEFDPAARDILGLVLTGNEQIRW